MSFLRNAMLAVRRKLLQRQQADCSCRSAGCWSFFWASMLSVFVSFSVLLLEEKIEKHHIDFS